MIRAEHRPKRLHDMLDWHFGAIIHPLAVMINASGMVLRPFRFTSAGGIGVRLFAPFGCQADP